jgi:hypothetical protein
MNKLVDIATAVAFISISILCITLTTPTSLCP